MKIEVIDGALYQWDTGRKIRIIPDDGMTVNEVHFDHYQNDDDAIVTKAESINGEYISDIPNILLQTDGLFSVYLTLTLDTDERTEYRKLLFITPRAKPADYVYTETEVLNYETLLKRINQIEENGVSDEQVEKAVTKYLDENPIETGVQFETDKTLTLENGVLSVNTADVVEEDNSLPITSAAVHTTVGNIEVLLKTI